MKRLLQINVSLNKGSTGRIAEQIGILAKDEGWEVYVAHSPRFKNPSVNNTIEVGTIWGVNSHAIQTRLFDNQGLASTNATKKLVKQILEIKPNVIHLHVIHGYYLNYKVLFEFLAESNIPVVWTLHDCWCFTGHCSHFDFYKCNKWEYEECRNCSHKHTYPKSLLFSASHRNFLNKVKAFTSIENNLTLVPVSHWLEGLIRRSFLNKCNIQTIHNGIDITVFSPISGDEKLKLRRKFGLEDKKVILGCAMFWTERKGYSDFFKLRQLLSNEYAIIMIGMNMEQKTQADKAGIIGITKTDSQRELAMLYSMSDVFINPTYEDNFPTTNLEALACGTPVITYKTGGSTESISKNTGKIVSKGDVEGMAAAIIEICKNGKNKYEEACRTQAISNYDGNVVYKQYIELYNKILK